jgi:hypothetical protein
MPLRNKSDLAAYQQRRRARLVEQACCPWCAKPTDRAAGLRCSWCLSGARGYWRARKLTASDTSNPPAKEPAGQPGR